MPSDSTACAAVFGNPEFLRGAPQERWVSDRLCGRQQQQPSRFAGKSRESPSEALFDAGGERQRHRKAEAARELGGRQPARELDQREWIPARLGDDPLKDGFVKPSR
jgi:hypothetical protein